MHVHRLLAQDRAWTGAPNTGLDAYATAQARMWRDIADDDPDPWTDRIADAAERWANHRHGQN